jgi:hypothetical protein
MDGARLLDALRSVYDILADNLSKLLPSDARVAESILRRLEEGGVLVVPLNFTMYRWWSRVLNRGDIIGAMTTSINVEGKDYDVIMFSKFTHAWLPMEHLRSVVAHELTHVVGYRLIPGSEEVAERMEKALAEVAPDLVKPSSGADLGPVRETGALRKVDGILVEVTYRTGEWFEKAKRVGFFTPPMVREFPDAERLVLEELGRLERELPGFEGVPVWRLAAALSPRYNIPVERNLPLHRYLERLLPEMEREGKVREVSPGAYRLPAKPEAVVPPPEERRGLWLWMGEAPTVVALMLVPVGLAAGCVAWWLLGGGERGD